MISIVSIISLLFEILRMVLLIRIVLSWLPHNRYHPLINIVYQITEPLLEPFRNMINPIGGIDLSPIIVFFLINLVKGYLLNFLMTI
jgi:YggT family protein